MNGLRPRRSVFSLIMCILHLYKGLGPEIKRSRVKLMTKYKAHCRGDPFLSGEWSPFIGEGEFPSLVVFRCGTPSCSVSHGINRGCILGT